MDLPVWREKRDEWHPRGLEVVTVALDVDPERARPAIEAAQPTHPSLIDSGHLLDELLGIVNVPSGVWIDEQGMIVRPPEPAWPGRAVWREIMRENKVFDKLDEMPAYVRDTLELTRAIKTDPAKYLSALEDWVEKGADSVYALSPDEVVARSRPRPPEHARAAAHFELGQHLHRQGFVDDAVAHFREAHRLQPDNWTYKRQAWSMVDPLQGPTEYYDGDWVTDVRALGPETYYAPLDM